MANTKYSYDEKRGGWTTLVWDGTYTKTGEKHRKRLTSRKSSRDLENMVKAHNDALANRSAVEYSALSFYEYAVNWVQMAKAAKEKNTQRMYEAAVKTYFAGLDNIRVGDVRHSHFQQLINENMEHPRTCQIISMTFKQIVRAAARDHLISRLDLDDLLQDIATPRYVRAERRPLSETEKRAVLAADFDERNGAFVYLLYFCGLHKSEALALARDDFDWEKKTVRVRRAAHALRL